MNRVKQFLSYQWKHGGSPIKIIAANILIFVVYKTTNVILSGTVLKEGFQNVYSSVFVANASWNGFLMKPWAILTSLFAHTDFFHLVLNMLLLFFAQQMFRPIFGEKRFLTVYFIGGLFGYLLELIIFESFKGILYTHPHGIIGASGAIMAILMAAIAYQPKTKIKLFGLISIPLFVLGIIMMANDLLGIFRPDSQTAHFAHIGGAIVGFLAGYKGATSKNVFNKISNLFQKKQNSTSYQTPPKNDHDYASKKRDEENEINKILEKIKKNGYDSLSKKEKQRLFTASNKK